MELNLKERTYVGIPDEFYNPNAQCKISLDNFKIFSYQAKVVVKRDLRDFFNEAGNVYSLLRDAALTYNGCKVYTCADLELHETHDLALNSYDKLQVIALLDIDKATKIRYIESLLRKWFEAGKSLVIYYEKDIKTLDFMYSKWFVSLLSVKTEGY